MLAHRAAETAEHHDADILTCDADFKDFERVVHIDKKTDLDVTQVFDGGA
ncbi:MULTISPECIES: hypothetical protein [unclassified Rhizobium]|nr:MULTISPECIES: hypothetical protein [unclassified Rhizobium]